jgi:hypothetical protein
MLFVCLIDGRGDIYVGVCNPGSSLFCPLVVEMRGEGFVRLYVMEMV